MTNSKRNARIDLMKYIKTSLMQCVLLHQIIRASIYNMGYIETIKSLSLNLCKKVDKYKFLCRLSIKKIKKILKYIQQQDLHNNIVSSCISITLLAHLLCIFSNKDSQIIVGVKIENGKVLSHSWLEVGDKQILNYFTDYKEYHIIKKFCLENI